jgi:hypothetical protein
MFGNCIYIASLRVQRLLEFIEAVKNGLMLTDLLNEADALETLAPRQICSGWCTSC